MNLRVLNIEQWYGKRKIVKGISFSVNSGSIVALLGPNGAGKTTLLRTVIGLQQAPYSPDKSINTIFLNDDLISTYSVSQRVHAGLVYVPQHSSLFQSLSVHDNLLMVYEYHDYWLEGTKKYSSDEIKAQRSFEQFKKEMNRWIERTSLNHVMNQPASTLSGGQKRKLEVVRALLLHPSVILFDEPFAGVDPKSIYELKDIFVELAREGMGIVVSDHHVDQLLSIATTIYVVVSGEVVVSGGIKEVMENEYTKQMYLGEEFHSEIVSKYFKK